MVVWLAKIARRSNVATSKRRQQHQQTRARDSANDRVEGQMKRDRLIERPNKAPGVLRVAKRRPIVEPGSGDDGERRERERERERRTSSVGQEPEDERRCGEGSQSEKMAEGVETGQPNQVVLKEDGKASVPCAAAGKTERQSRLAGVVCR